MRRTMLPRPLSERPTREVTSSMLSPEISVHGSCDRCFEKRRDRRRRLGGRLDFGKSRKRQNDSWVNVDSTTKGMTTTCGCRLIEQGKLGVRSPGSTEPGEKPTKRALRRCCATLLPAVAPRRAASTELRVEDPPDAFPWWRENAKSRSA